MSTPSGAAVEGLLLPAERARRGGAYLGMVLAVMLCLAILEGVSVFVGGVLIAGDDMGTMGSPGVGGYVGLPVIAAVVSLPLFALAWRQPALRIDPTGISKVRRRGTETVPWADIDKVQFTTKRSILVLVMKAGSRPGKPNAVGGPTVAVPYYSLGNSLWRRRRPAHHDLIVDAVERFAPGRYTVEPWNLGKGGATGAGASV
ncbi:PH domain-containing protein [Streptomyces sp. NBC_00846]|uniref:PH domain-containing protein n=1 Tax=Streptomyces sp. NBC_00846 TaxID=2975849 RepID=UPI003866A2AD|nr:PH domain-containing protein [Streptomyces sp. NBC_00846]